VDVLVADDRRRRRCAAGVRVVKAFSNEQRELNRFDQRSDEYTVHEQEVNDVWATLQPIIAATMHSAGRWSGSSAGG
jgi:ABC-type multidrug transport system fused ATPase/permease subunit